MTYINKSAMKSLGLDPSKMKHSSEEINKKMAQIKKFIFDEKVTLIFIPSPALQKIIAQNDEPLIKDMPDVRKAELLTGHGIPIQKDMVYKWLTGRLDKKREFILERGEIRLREDTTVKLIGDISGK
tara:strand:+ start:867 stop:1247 length:381 start_codon:yes stop_codon:yes gene_type:complete